VEETKEYNHERIRKSGKSKGTPLTVIRWKHQMRIRLEKARRQKKGRYEHQNCHRARQQPDRATKGSIPSISAKIKQGATDGGVTDRKKIVKKIQANKASRA